MAEIQFTSEEREAYIDRIRRLPAHLEGLVAGLTDEQLHTPFLAGEWTVAQNVHHVYDSHVMSYMRLKRILTEDNPTLHPYDQDAFATLADYSLPISNALNLLYQHHARWVRIFESLDEPQWVRVGTLAASGRQITPEDLVKLYAEHGEAHLDQIRRTLAAGEGA
ncbi:DinB family protein [Phototrophicus methaneseepsis]|uniref:DinB family protein n=1 Tax=Phototrophicus methaneseepsis TaxID=2710758 RepID=A0A7S8IEL8_9CHLR|nr:DinB family protein [Phototrophicus methaneseepsis]QPC83820.1 DinB family protein [Phototrophicus methaneseepsis]